MAEYIEREATIKLLRSLGSRDYRREKGTIQEAIKMVSFPEYTPSADVAQVRHGQWIEYTRVIIPEPYNKWEQAWKCSECGFDDGFVAYNYCQNCGCRMDGGDDE